MSEGNDSEPPKGPVTEWTPLPKPPESPSVVTGWTPIEVPPAPSSPAIEWPPLPKLDSAPERIKETQNIDVDQKVNILINNKPVPLETTLDSQVAAAPDYFVASMVSNELPDSTLQSSQDAIRIEKEGNMWRFAIADGAGQGGAFAGDAAVVAAVSALNEELTQLAASSPRNFLEQLTVRLNDYFSSIPPERVQKIFSSMQQMLREVQQGMLEQGPQTTFAYGTLQETGTVTTAGQKLKTGQLTYLGVGEGEYFVVRRDGTVTSLKSTKGSRLSPKGVIGQEFADQVDVVEGDIICFASDGITYTDDPKQKNEIIQQIQEAQRQGNNDLSKISLRRVADDVTFLAIHFK